MNVRRSLLVAIVICFPALTFAANRDMEELQRDVAQLQDQVRSLQRSQDENLTALRVLAQQALDAANKSNTALAVLENNIRQTLQAQEKNVVGPVAGVGAKVDEMSTNFGVLRDSVSDIASRLSKLQQQMVDLGNAVRTIQTPAAPPPGGGTPGAMNSGSVP